ncbi:MAG: ATP-binding protein [Candidatus Bruticola sp.]
MSVSSVIGASVSSAKAGRLLERNWLQKRFQEACQNHVRVVVFAAEPGMGKSSFLKKLAEEYTDSVYVEIRRPLSTDTAIGFWRALLSQLDLDGIQIPDTPYEAAVLAKQHLPFTEEGKLRLVIIDALGRAPDLVDNEGLAGLDSLPEGVVVVIGTRPGRHLDILEAAGAQVEWIDSNCAENLTELRTWTRNQFTEAPEEYIDNFVKGSEGNFLIARHLLQAIRNKDIEPHELEATPKSLEAALSVLWEEQYEQAPFDIHDDLVFVACLIAEAGEPLPAVSIADFLGFSASRVGRVLTYLRPLLRHNRVDEGLSFFSKRLGRLISCRYRRDLVQVHEQVISFFRDSYPSWDEMDDRYGWFYLGYHCDRFARTARRCDFSTLHWLGEGPYIRTKLLKTHSLGAVLDDLSRCLRAALQERELPRIVSYGLRIPRLRAKEVMNGLHDLADAGQFDLAADRAMLLHRESSKLKALLLLAWQAMEEGQIEVAKALTAKAGTVVYADMDQEDRLLFAFIMVDLLKIMPLSKLEPIFLACRDMSHSSSVAWRLSIMAGLTKAKRLEILKLALSCAQRIGNKQERERHIKRLTEDIAAVKRSKVCEYDLSKALVSEVNAVEFKLDTNEELLKRIADIDKTTENERSQTFRTALEFIGSYKDEAKRVEAISHLVVELVKYSNENWIIASFEDLITTIVALHSPVYRQKAIIDASRLITGVPRTKGWRDVFVRLDAVIETIEDPALRVGAWVWLSLARYEARDYKGAQDTLNLSASLAFHIANLEEQAKALSLLSSCAAAIGCPARARNLAFHSLQAWEAPSAVRVDTETRAAMVVGISANINEERSLEYYDSSIKAALEIPDMRVRANLLAALASNLYKMGEDDWARRTQDKALEVAKSMEANASQSITLAQLAMQESLCGNVSSSDQILIDAEESARSESVPEKRREALLTVASSKRSGGDEAGARMLILEVISELEKLDIQNLRKASDLCILAKLIKEPRSKETLLKLLKKIRRSLKGMNSEDKQQTQLLIVRCLLALGEYHDAVAEYLEISDVKIKSEAKISLAVSIIKNNPNMALQLLAGVPIFSLRMSGVKKCADELMSDKLAGKRTAALDTLAELTIMAAEDEKCADVLIAKWVSLSNDRKAITESLTKIGYPLKDVLTGQINEPTVGQD